MPVRPKRILLHHPGAGPWREVYQGLSAEMADLTSTLDYPTSLVVIHLKPEVDPVRASEIGDVFARVIDPSGRVEVDVPEGEW